MSQLSLKPGDRLTIDGFDGDIVLEFDHIADGCAHLSVSSMEDISVKRGNRKQPADRDDRRTLQDMTGEVLACFSELDAAESQQLATQFVSDLFYALAQKRQKEERRVKQAEGIAEAKVRGVRFGRAAKSLPPNFQACHEAWRGGQMTLRQAAKACGMPHSSFYTAAVRMECAG